MGLGDRSAPVSQLRPINLTPGTIERAATVLAGEPAGNAHLTTMLDLVDGFETPYSIELLATVHFAAVQKPVTRDPADLSARVVSWSLRKARLFTDAHVRLAVRTLADHQLLPAIGAS